MKLPTQDRIADIIRAARMFSQDDDAAAREVLAEIEELNKYNGWSNYETWLVKLWIDNEQESYTYWQEKAKELYEQAGPTEYWTREESALYGLAEALQEAFDDMDEMSGMATDLVHAALSEVNWREIAESLLEDNKTTA